jgi:hypothetical protein
MMSGRLIRRCFAHNPYATAVIVAPFAAAILCACQYPRQAEQPSKEATALGPLHVHNSASYGVRSSNVDIPASWMATNVDVVIDAGYPSSTHAQAFKNAGGKFAIEYTNPTYLFYCSPPLTEPAGPCTGPWAPIDSTGYLHDSSGARIAIYTDSQHQYRETANVGSVSAATAYSNYTAALLRGSPSLDGFQADDSGSPFTSLEAGSSSVEITSDLQWQKGESAILQAAAKPLIINGGNPLTRDPAYNGYFLKLSYVFGQMYEDCFDSPSMGQFTTDTVVTWANEANGLLAGQALGKTAMCMPTGSASSSARLYTYASWLLIDAPPFSVYDTDIVLSNNHSIAPEVTVVPTQPTKSAKDISDLAIGGVYVREFGACFVSGVPIGACAAVVNPTTSVQSIPALSTSYGAHLLLDAASSYDGGKARVAPGGVTSLAAASAALLVR